MFSLLCRTAILVFWAAQPLMACGKLITSEWPLTRYSLHSCLQPRWPGASAVRRSVSPSCEAFLLVFFMCSCIIGAWRAAFPFVGAASASHHSQQSVYVSCQRRAVSAAWKASVITQTSDFRLLFSWRNSICRRFKSIFSSNLPWTVEPSLGFGESIIISSVTGIFPQLRILKINTSSKY